MTPYEVKPNPKKRDKAIAERLRFKQEQEAAEKEALLKKWKEEAVG